MKKAVVLLSGGVDSTTCLALVKSNNISPYTITFNYGQKHYHEIQAAKKVALHFGVKEHKVINLNIGEICLSALTTSNISIPKNRKENEIKSTSIPVTYVPARNIIFLSIAASWAETLGISWIYIGANVIDYSGYPDCRPQFLSAFENALNIGTKMGTELNKQFHICAPLIKMTKGEIIKLGIKLGVDYGITHSCYDPLPGGNTCGKCDSCIIRKKGFQEAGIRDPALSI